MLHKIYGINPTQKPIGFVLVQKMVQRDVGQTSSAGGAMLDCLWQVEGGGPWAVPNVSAVAGRCLTGSRRILWGSPGW